MVPASQTPRDRDTLPKDGPATPALQRLAAAVLLGVSSIAAHAATGPAATEAVRDAPPEFDMEILKQRGVDPQIAEFLRYGARFTPGRHRVALTVNGAKRGRLLVRFDAQGQLCIDADLLAAARLQPPGRDEAPTACAALAARFPGAIVELDPAAAEIALVVPPEAVLPETGPDPSAGYEHGGIGGLLNYDLYATRSDTGGTASQYAQATVLLGLNADDWIVRSLQTYTHHDGISRIEHLNAFAQRTFARHQAVLQAGQINFSNLILPTASITGFQLLPESALTARATGGGAIEGVAYSQARVDVRQAGALIYSTIVPSGPFALANLPLINTQSALDVTIREADGSERVFSVPAVTVTGAVPIASGYSLAAGTIRNPGGTSDAFEPWVISASKAWQVRRNASLVAGATMAADYWGTGAGTLWNASDSSVVGGQVQVSNARRESVTGSRVAMSLQQRLGAFLSLSASATHQTEGYRDLVDITLVDPATAVAGRPRDQLSLGLSRSSARLGGFGVSYSDSRAFDGLRTSRGTASWGKNFKHFSTSTSSSWQLDDNNAARGLPPDRSIYFSLSVPLGRRSLLASARHRDDATSIGVDLSEKINDMASYRVGVDHESDARQLDWDASMSLRPRYAQLDLGYARFGSEGRSRNLGLRGGIALHGEGVTFSPYALGDSFAVLDVGDTAGVQVSTPGGPVWTDWRGKAVVPQLTAYGTTPVQVVAKSLPIDTDIDNGYQEILAGRGAVTQIDFTTRRTRRVLLETATAGDPGVARGAMIMDGDGNLLTIAGEAGQVFLTDDPTGKRVFVHLAGQDKCELVFRLPEAPDHDDYFETITAVCRPVAGDVQ